MEDAEIQMGRSNNKVQILRCKPKDSTSGRIDGMPQNPNEKYESKQDVCAKPSIRYNTSDWQGQWRKPEQQRMQKIISLQPPT